MIAPGLGDVRTEFEERGLGVWRGSEYASPNYYRAVLEDEERGLVLAEMSASKSHSTCIHILWIDDPARMHTDRACRLEGRTFKIHIPT